MPSPKVRNTATTVARLLPSWKVRRALRCAVVVFMLSTLTG